MKRGQSLFSTNVALACYSLTIGGSSSIFTLPYYFFYLSYSKTFAATNMSIGKPQYLGQCQNLLQHFVSVVFFTYLNDNNLRLFIHSP